MTSLASIRRTVKTLQRIHASRAGSFSLFVATTKDDENKERERCSNEFGEKHILYIVPLYRFVAGEQASTGCLKAREDCLSYLGLMT